MRNGGRQLAARNPARPQQRKTGAEVVARWARRPVSLGPGASIFEAFVLGPERIPFVTDAASARAAPELAVLSAPAHGERPNGLPVVLAALEAAAGLEHDRSMLYCDVVWRAAGAALRCQLEELMQSGGYTYQSDFAKRYLAQGKAEGEAKGKAEGEAKGKAEGEAQALLRILAARGLAISEDQRARMLDCTNLPLLDAWIDRALEATTVVELLDFEPAAPRR
ncbi:MAG: hypothetical protein IPL40_05500 [Proteobacteria bacterium]|nr:hypothetical protein [Pseudomonadota bacterium]